MSLLQFVEESNRIEGISGSHELIIAIAAHEKFLDLKQITVADLELFVSTVQPGAILRRSVGLNVRVGDHIAPPGGALIEDDLNSLLEAVHLSEYNEYGAHVRYETLHPFTDGNGRSGRALWLWMRGGHAPLGFLHHFYYQTLGASR